MCAPIVPLVGAIGTGISMAASMGQAKAQAAAAEANAQAESNAAQISQQNMRQAALQQYQQMAAVSGQQRMMAAADGDATNYGTAANALNDTQILGNERLAQIYSQGNQSLVGSDIAVANDLGQANAANSRGDAALAGGLLGLGTGLFGGSMGNSALTTAQPTSVINNFGTALGAASQYSPLKMGMGL
jgi:hypothetical protein